MTCEVSFVSFFNSIHIHTSSKTLKPRRSQDMFDTTTDTRKRDAIRAAHDARGKALLDGLRLIFGTRDR